MHPDECARFRKDVKDWKAGKGDENEPMKTYKAYYRDTFIEYEIDLDLDRVECIAVTRTWLEKGPYEVKAETVGRKLME